MFQARVHRRQPTRKRALQGGAVPLSELLLSVASRQPVAVFLLERSDEPFPRDEVFDHQALGMFGALFGDTAQAQALGTGLVLGTIHTAHGPLVRSGLLDGHVVCDVLGHYCR